VTARSQRGPTHTAIPRIPRDTHRVRRGRCGREPALHGLPARPPVARRLDGFYALLAFSLKRPGGRSVRITVTERSVQHDLRRPARPPAVFLNSAKRPNLTQSTVCSEIASSKTAVQRFVLRTVQPAVTVLGLAEQAGSCGN